MSSAEQLFYIAMVVTKTKMQCWQMGYLNFFNLAKLKNTIIVQKCLEKGHTQMEADSVHSQIERQIRRRNFKESANYVGAIKNARTNPPAIEPSLSQLKILTILSFIIKKIRFLKSIRLRKNLSDPCIVDIRAIQYTPKEIFFKLRFIQNGRCSL